LLLPQAFTSLPLVPASDWVKAQKAIESGIMKICYNANKGGRP